MADANKLKITAEILFVEQGKSQKEISKTIGVSEVTISKWAKAGKWKEKRDALMNVPAKRAEDIKAVIGTLTERRIEITNELTEARKAGNKKVVAELQIEAVSIGQEVAMYSKALQAVEKTSKPTLSLYLDIMADVFKNLNEYDPELYLKTLDFQEFHISIVAERLG